MNSVDLPESDPRYPTELKRWLSPHPASLQFAGPLEILQTPMLGWMSSVKCPGPAVAQAYDYAQKIRAEGRTVIGGFHSPMEWECLRIFLCSRQRIVICPARNLRKMRLAGELQRGFGEGRILFLSPFAQGPDRASSDLADARNEMVAALAAEVFVAHVSCGGKMARLMERLASWGKPVRVGG